jgi:hypothetical protein
MMDTLLDILATTNVWKYPDFVRLDDGLGEIRWKFDKKQYRLIGCSWKDPGGYLLLIGCTHKQQVYDPPDAIATADKRRRGLKFEKKGSVHEHTEDCETEGQGIS